MRTTKSTATFRNPSSLKNVGELPAGTYEIETDEEEIFGTERMSYRRVATLLYVKGGGKTRTCTIDPIDLEAALRRDADPGQIDVNTVQP